MGYLQHQQFSNGQLKAYYKACHEYVFIYIDDILVTGATEEEHLDNLEAVFSRLEQAGYRLKRQKCAFLLPSIEYLGHIITEEGLKPSKKKVEAIIDAPTPIDVSQLRSFLGLMNYYRKFLPNLSSVLAPLHRLLHKEVKWSWGKEQEFSFKEAKKLLTYSQLLVHFDPDKNLVLTCDASPYGIGAVLSHLEDGTEKPIYYASPRSLAIPERGYSQLDKEALAIIFGVKKFHQFLYDRPFIIDSDHKPLQYILGQDRPVPQLASARLQRWSLTLGAYNYKIHYKPGAELSHAEGLSRLPLADVPAEIPLPGETIMLMDHLERSVVNAKQISCWTTRDPTLSRVYRFLISKWPDLPDEDLIPFQRRRDELSLESGCIL